MEKIKGADQDTVIREAGEAGLTLKLAVESGIDVESPEPKFEREIEYLIEQGYGKEEIFAYYMYRQVEQYHRNNEEYPIAEYLAPYLREFHEKSNWVDFDYSLEHLSHVGERIWGEKGRMLLRNSSRTDPTPRESNKKSWTVVNSIAQHTS